MLLLQWVYFQTFEFSIVLQLHPTEPSFLSPIWFVDPLQDWPLSLEAPLLAYFPFDPHGHTHINNWLVPFDYNNINSNFWFGIFLFLFHYFLPHMKISSYMSFTTTKTPHSILPKSIILIITMLVISVILILLTIALPTLTIWSWIILLISKLIIWCVVFM